MHEHLIINTYPIAPAAYQKWGAQEQKVGGLPPYFKKWGAHTFCNIFQFCTYYMNFYDLNLNNYLSFNYFIIWYLVDAKLLNVGYCLLILVQQNIFNNFFIINLI